MQLEAPPTLIQPKRSLSPPPHSKATHTPPQPPTTPPPTAPLVTHIYTADPSAHVFPSTSSTGEVTEGRIYVYPSHDRAGDIPFNDRGDQYDMVDYHVLSLARVSYPDGNDAEGRVPVAEDVVDHGVALALEQVPWASKQLWAPDAFKGQDGLYWLCFPARDKQGIFRLGLAHSPSPTGPFTAHPSPIPGSFSIDPATFVDPTDGSVYVYFGGIWGGQLQCYSQPAGGPFARDMDGPHEPSGPDTPALRPRVARLAYDPSAPPGEGYTAFAHPPRELEILDPDTRAPIGADDHERRFFEAAWMHERHGVYYLSYSTGDTHSIAHATGSGPEGPFVYRGTIMPEVEGWTTHHSIVEHLGRWWLFFHDCEMSAGVSHLRSVRAREVFYEEDGRIVLERPA